MLSIIIFGPSNGYWQYVIYFALGKVVCGGFWCSLNRKSNFHVSIYVSAMEMYLYI